MWESSARFARDDPRGAGTHPGSHNVNSGEADNSFQWPPVSRAAEADIRRSHDDVGTHPYPHHRAATNHRSAQATTGSWGACVVPSSSGKPPPLQFRVPLTSGVPW